MSIVIKEEDVKETIKYLSWLLNSLTFVHDADRGNVTLLIKKWKEFYCSNNPKIENNVCRPTEPGMYETIDARGNETITYWTGNMWLSNTGHPVEFWKQQPEEPSDIDLEFIHAGGLEDSDFKKPSPETSGIEPKQHVMSEPKLNILNEEEANLIIKDNELDTNKISDGYHTFGELYEHRIVLFITLCHFVNLYTTRIVWKSRFHNDGSSLGGWFIVGIDEEPGKQISYHLSEKYWEQASFVIYPKSPKWDGHTSADVLERLKQLCYE